MVHGTLRHWLAVIASRNKAFQVRSVTRVHTTKRLFQAAECMTCILICVALATSGVQSILDISATDEIHVEDRNYGLA